MSEHIDDSLFYALVALFSIPLALAAIPALVPQAEVFLLEVGVLAAEDVLVPIPGLESGLDRPRAAIALAASVGALVLLVTAGRGKARRREAARS